MTALDRFDRVFADVLADVAQPAYPDYIDDALAVATRKPQRPAWTFPERWLPMTSLTRAAPLFPGIPFRRLALLAVVALLVATIALIAAGAFRRPAPPFGPAANGLIALEIDGNILLRNPTDGTTTSIVDGPELQVLPSFSGDGLSLAYLVIDPATQGTSNELVTVYVANADGSSARPLVGPVDLRGSAWSPDGRALAVVTGVGTDQELSIHGLDGSSRTLELGAITIDNWIAWRPPDGRELVFVGNDTGSVGFYRLPTGGGEAVRITPRTSQVALGGMPGVLTPDGRMLVYENTANEIDIRVVDLDSGDVRVWGTRLPEPDGGPGSGPMHEGAPYLSSDGTKLAFGRYWDDDGQLINHQYWAGTLAGDGVDAIPVGPLLRSQGGFLPWQLVLSPDGSQIVVHHLETNETWLTDWNDRTRHQVDWGVFYDGSWQRLPR